MSRRTKTKTDLDPQLEELVKAVKTPEQLAALTQQLQQKAFEAMLEGEMTDHLGYPKHATAGHNTGNSRNGYSAKTLKGEQGALTLDVPRDRNGEFEPLIIPKGQTRLPMFNDKILALYSRGMSTRDIVAMLLELYGVEVSPTLISQVTAQVIEEVQQWQCRPLDEIYPIVYLDCIHIKIRQDKRVSNKAIYLALGINLDGQKELLGLWLNENEGAKFWLSVLTELQQRGVRDIFIAAVDGLTGFPEAINTVYPKTKIQLCIVHMVRNSLKFVAWKQRKAVAADLKKIYTSLTVAEAEQELDAFAARWDDQFPSISASWRRHWPNLITLFDYPDDIRRVIYTTNAIESLNSVIRKAVKNRKVFPNDESALKVVYLAIQAASKKWTMPIHHWKNALNRFMIEFPDRMPEQF
ncbi:IS256 family transposase [Thiohalophilus sp.]|uniref:IS256 family transposase n=1 Tax=Thiohalophilus sp. TaxID=3028392 RepID=UPI002ACE780E|nr:IS256 family transposase [Thiohalophilus sp.]MDZ7660946.1 IS256 family transposase [Thiohalophilus sp.]MDZ7661022.1 IS256 family transposase [Thiohalophilus sp.]MDZ7661044.1 IS256 family transposase [Thiohalophilus sp.]MDZ7661062.1 IS256 family transposase [Thiohalophilus sp.]MDZ7661212.1 IS256 family transposase [Thiohalophilus sp.]